MDDTCNECLKHIEGSQLIGCDRCDNWFHLSCVNLSASEVKQILNYYCIKCHLTYDLITEWRKIRAPISKRLDKNKNYYEVGSIKSTKGQPPNRKFLVGWKDFSSAEDSWEPEENLDCALDLMQDFLLKAGLPLSNIQGYMGSSNSHLVNRKNWLPMETLLQEFDKYKNWYCKDISLPFRNFDGFQKEDTLFFLKWDNHCYVLLFISEKKTAYIADGTNLFRNDTKISSEISSFLDIRLISCKFDYQRKADHCVSSAVMIGVEMMRSYQAKLPPLIINIPKSWYDRICAALHKYDSKSINSMNLKLGRRRYKCRTCTASYNKARAMRAHELLCKDRTS